MQSQAGEETRGGYGVEEEIFLMLQTLKERKSAELFIERINAEDAPNYYQTISNPIHLIAIETKLKQGTYQYCRQIKSDLMLIIENSKSYNQNNHSILKITDKFASCINTDWKIFLATLSKKGMS